MKKQVCIYIDVEMIEKLKALAQAENRSLTGQIITLLQKALDK